MGKGALDLAFAKGRFSILLGLPYPKIFCRNFLVDRIGKLADTRLIQLRPELRRWHGAVKQYVQSAVVGIIKAFQIDEGLALPAIGRMRGALRLCFTSPQGATVSQIVQLIE